MGQEEENVSVEEDKLKIGQLLETSASEDILHTLHCTVFIWYLAKTLHKKEVYSFNIYTFNRLSVAGVIL